MSSESERLFAHVTERSTLPSIEIQLRGAPQTLSENTVGGQPYLTPSEKAPVGQDGVPLVFLAPLNLAELPANDLLPAFASSWMSSVTATPPAGTVSAAIPSSPRRICAPQGMSSMCCCSR